MTLRTFLASLAVLSTSCALPAFGGPDDRTLPPPSEAEAASALMDLHAARTDSEALAALCAEEEWGNCDGLELAPDHRLSVRCSFTLPRFAPGPEGDARVLVVESDPPDGPVSLAHVPVEMVGRGPAAVVYESAPVLLSWTPDSGNYRTRHTYHPGGVGMDAGVAAEVRRLQAVVARSCEEPELFTQLLLRGDVEHGFDPELPAGVYTTALAAEASLRAWAEIGQPLELDELTMAPEVQLGFRDALRMVDRSAVAEAESWRVTIPDSRPILAGETVDVLALLADEENEQLDLEVAENRKCVAELAPIDGLSRLDGVTRVSIQPRHVTWCGQWFSIDLYIEVEDPYEIIAIGLDVGDALRPTEDVEG